MNKKKMAFEITPGDKLESVGHGVFLVVRAQTVGNVTSIIGTIGGVLTQWAHYNSADEFTLVTVH